MYKKFKKRILFMNEISELCTAFKKDGFTLATEVREKDPNVPIIFLTARSVKEDVLKGFKSGADDYITKPFNSEELLLRINAIMKRSSNAVNPREEQKEFIFGKYHFNFPLRILTFDQGGENAEQFKLSPNYLDQDKA